MQLRDKSFVLLQACFQGLSSSRPPGAGEKDPLYYHVSPKIWDVTNKWFEKVGAKWNLYALAEHWESKQIQEHSVAHKIHEAVVICRLWKWSNCLGIRSTVHYYKTKWGKEDDSFYSSWVRHVGLFNIHQFKSFEDGVLDSSFHCFIIHLWNYWIEPQYCILADCSFTSVWMACLNRFWTTDLRAARATEKIETKSQTLLTLPWILIVQKTRDPTMKKKKKS